MGEGAMSYCPPPQKKGGTRKGREESEKMERKIKGK